MKCLHCSIEVHPHLQNIPIGKDNDGEWVIERYHCPSCNRFNIFLVGCSGVLPPSFAPVNVSIRYPIYPKSMSRPIPPEVPPEIVEDYEEACLVLTDSPKASAALSRRCLQNILRNAANVKPSDLSKEIQEVLDRGNLPSHIADIIDSVRNIGNFAAHPQKSTSTGDIVPVEPEEAEWNLEVLEALFDFYYVQPSRNAQRRRALDAKLASAGKPPMK